MNPNLFIWTSDWHVASNDTEPGFATYPTGAAQVTAHIASLEPAGVIDTGDCKDDYGLASGDELDNYVARVRGSMPWATVNPGANALYPILPGNHDEVADSYDLPANDFSIFNAKFWGPPYHWTCDWDAPKIRFIGIHSRIVHHGEPVFQYAGAFVVDQAERDWLDAELAALPDEWQAIVCSHAPLDPAFGNNIGHWTWLDYGGPQIRAILLAHAPRVSAYLNGHRHGNMMVSMLDGVRHFNGPGMAYTQGNSYGAWGLIEYDPVERTLTMHCLLGPPSTYPPVAMYSPVVVQLPLLSGLSVYTFNAATVLAGEGPLEGAQVLVSGTVEAQGETVTATSCSPEMGPT